MYGVRKIMWGCEGFTEAFGDDPEDVSSIFVRNNYENSGTEFIHIDADTDQLEEIANHFGGWGDAVAQSGVPDDCTDTEQYLRIVPGAMTLLRAAVGKLVDDWGWVCNKYDIAPEVDEVLEHWIVSDWLAHELKERGETVGEFAGLTIWGRCTTGQSIALDHGIQEIAVELWSNEYKVLNPVGDEAQP